MRIGELSRRTGVPVPTIKYYVREGMLPSGELTRPNQASYGEPHERRLRLIRALLDVGGMKVSEISDVLQVIDDGNRPVHKVLGAATDGLGSAGAGQNDAEAEAADAVVADFIAKRGWRVHESTPAVAELSRALAAMDRLGHGAFVGALDTYADAAVRVAGADLAYVDAHTDVENIVESAVIATVLGEAVFGALRRLAHVDASARVYGEPAGDRAGG
ncbi:zinc-responsive transcriptional regulator [Streptomyces sp. YIM 130001]|uniref:MerR family transcriptional regulator n=1 Tax=Streptomyces sp. YIM 130001 TaxID=2259644 RepID=UPI000EDBF5B7|nr:MerR family transcriptional regulator [Streptomyces sp. YIM 130001]RII20770.1 zinc-responsive transcriptional regulator [Streptomyces sp. YIM 130001]